MEYIKSTLTYDQNPELNSGLKSRTTSTGILGEDYNIVHYRPKPHCSVNLHSGLHPIKFVSVNLSLY